MATKMPADLVPGDVLVRRDRRSTDSAVVLRADRLLLRDAIGLTFTDGSTALITAMDVPVEVMGQ